MDSELYKTLASEIERQVSEISKSSFVERFEDTFVEFDGEEYGGIDDKPCGFVTVRLNGAMKYKVENTHTCNIDTYSFSQALIIVAGGYGITDRHNFGGRVESAFQYAELPTASDLRVLRKELIETIYSYEDAITGEFNEKIKSRKGFKIVKIHAALHGKRFINRCCEVPCDNDTPIITTPFVPVP